MKSVYLLHINTSYAEIPKSELSMVSEKSYLPFFRLLQKYDLGSVLLNITGLSIEYFVKHDKTVLKIANELIQSDKIKIAGCTYSHPILPLLPSDDIRKQIKLHKKLVQEYLNTTPIGFFPPELAIDPILPNYLIEEGYEFIFCDGETIQNSIEFPNSYSPVRKQPTRLTSHLLAVDKTWGIRKLYRTLNAFRLLRKQEKNLDLSTKKMLTIDPSVTFPVLPGFSAINTTTQLAVSRRVPWVTPKRQIKVWKKIRERHEGKESIFVPYATDLEFIGYREIAEGMGINPSEFIDFMRMAVDNNFEPEIPTKSDWKNASPTYVKSSSWTPDQNWELWTRDPDNIKLELLCDEIRSKLRIYEDGSKKEEIWKYLLIAENSDGRGWDPIPERKLDCMDAAVKALNLLEN
ncbi:MAG: polysaccharide deacetylase family protein [Candidatus Kariarchaeaceae archaeon]